MTHFLYRTSQICGQKRGISSNRSNLCFNPWEMRLTTSRDTKQANTAYKICGHHLLFFFWKHKLKGVPGSESGSLNLPRAGLRSLHYLTGRCSGISILSIWKEKGNENVQFRSKKRKGLVGTSEGAVLSTTVVTNSTSHESGDTTAFSCRDTMLSRVRQDQEGTCNQKHVF